MTRRTHHMTWRGVVPGDDVETTVHEAFVRARAVIADFDVDARITRLSLVDSRPGTAWDAEVDFTWEEQSDD